MFQTVQLCKRKLQNIKHGEHLSTQQPQDIQWLTESTPFSLAHCFLGFHRHDVINMLVRKRQVDKYVLHEENYIFLWWKR